MIVMFHPRGIFFSVEFKWYLCKRANLADAYCIYVSSLVCDCTENSLALEPELVILHVLSHCL